MRWASTSTTPGRARPTSPQAVIAYFGDGASSQGDVNEAFIWASVFNAPVVFFCQNNQWAISEPLEKQTKIPLYQRAQGFGFPGVARRRQRRARRPRRDAGLRLQRAREGAGPMLIEAYTYRMGAHTTSDDPTRYRLASELEQWKLKDPIERVRSYLFRNEKADQAFFDSIEAEAEQMAVRLRAECRALPDPDPTSIFDHVYAEQHALVDEERAAMAAYLDSFEGASH